MVTSHRAFLRATTAETMTAMLREDAPPFPARAAVPPAMQAIVHHCLEKPPDARRCEYAGDHRSVGPRDAAGCAEALLQPAGAVVRRPLAGLRHRRDRSARSLCANVPGRHRQDARLGQPGDAPAWSRDGHALYFRAGRSVMVVTFDGGRATKARALFQLAIPVEQPLEPRLDGRGFIGIQSGQEAWTARELRVVTNWLAELQPR
jgi:hypothetical protein